MLARFFKPKWQHNKAEIRLRAVTKLSADDPSSHEILKQLALRDQNAGVRRAALERVQDCSLLIKASQEDGDSQNRTCAVQQITQLISNTEQQMPIEQRLAALEHVTTTDLLFHLALNSPDSQFKQEVTQRISDENTLLDLIRKSDNSDLKLIAAEKIHSQGALEQLEKLAKGKDKRLFRISRSKLQLIKEQQQQQQADQARQEQLLESLKHLVNSETQPLFSAKLDALNSQWQQFPSTDNELQNQWQQLFKDADQLRLQRQAEQQKLEQQQAVEAQERKQCETLLVTVEEKLAVDSVITNTELQTLQQSWQQLSSSKTAKSFGKIPALLEQLQKQLNANQSLLDNSERLQSLSQAISKAIDTNNASAHDKLNKQLRALKKAINWPSNSPLPAEIQQLEAQIKQLASVKAQLQQAQKEEQSKFDAKLDSLAEQISAGEARKANRLNSQLQNQQSLMSGQQNQRYKQLYSDLIELRDWQGYALTPKRESLCQQMEALIGDDRQPEQLANDIKALQQQWRDLDATGVVHSRELWQRFKKASDTAYAPCDRFYADQRQVRIDNLHKREAMAEQLTNYVEQLDWEQADWKAVEEITRAAKSEWRHYSPVDRSPGRAVQTRFNKLINTLEGKLKAHRKSVLAAKEQILAEAIALLDEEDLNTATDSAKQLQQRWKEAGTTFRAQERQLWSDFRGYCNTLFAKRDEQSKLERQSRQQGYSKLKQLCLSLEQLLREHLSITELEAALNEHMQSYNSLCETENNLNSSQQKQFEQQSALLKAKLLQRKALFGDEYQQLKQAANKLSDLETALVNQSLEAPKIAALQIELEQLSLDESLKHGLLNRLETLQALHQSSEGLNDQIEQSGIQLRQLCIRLEITLGEASPDEDQAARLEYQMQRLQQALVQQKEGFDLADVKQLELERQLLPFNHYQAELSLRFDQLLSAVI